MIERINSFIRLRNSIFLNLIFLFFFSIANGQIINCTFLLGYNAGLIDTNVSSFDARLNFDANSVTVVPETRKMPFRATQATISDENGNLILVSNGCWIANANGDTMMNGSGLNPGPFTSSWCTEYLGLPIAHGNIILPYPGDSSKFILFHQTANNAANLASTELFYSLIDMNLDGGLGGVITTQKNIIALQDTLSWGLGACKHANGRDWWIVALKNSSNIIFKLLLTPQGISGVISDTLNVPIAYSNVTQPTFSLDGKRFAYTYGIGGPNGFHDVRIFNFDRCNGNLSDTTYIHFNDGFTGFGLAFSPDSKKVYVNSFQKIYQIDTLSNVINVATNDGFYSPYPPFQTDFWYMYLAANGKIYISSGSSVIDMHFINYPDSIGVACDVHQHGLHLPCYYVRGNVYHPNYYLGPVSGSACDSLGLGVTENNFDFHFRVFPNPVTDLNFNISYLMPQNRSGKLEIFDVTGKKIYKQDLPPWSTLQQISLPTISDGLYNCVITSGNERVSKKIALSNRD